MKNKAIILKAYLDGRISKIEMKLLLEKGISIPPIAWVNESLEESRRRDLLKRIFGIKFPMVEWIKTTPTDD